LGSITEQLSLTTVMRPPFFVPETKRIEDLLIDFRTRRVHMAIVVMNTAHLGADHHQDLLEEIVGDIQDEYDREEEWVQTQPDGSLLLDARANVEELEECSISKSAGEVRYRRRFAHSPARQRAACGRDRASHGLLLKVVESDERKVRKVQVWRDPEAGVPVAEG